MNIGSLSFCFVFIFSLLMVALGFGIGRWSAGGYNQPGAGRGLSSRRVVLPAPARSGAVAANIEPSSDGTAGSGADKAKLNFEAR